MPSIPIAIASSKNFATRSGSRTVEQGAIDRQPEAPRLRRLDGRHGAIKRAVLAHRAVMHLAIAVQMHVPREIWVRLILLELLLQQQRVRAQIDELLPLQDAADDLRHLLVQQRLATGDRHHRRPALIDRIQRVLHRQPLVQDRRRIIDLPAPAASQIAPEQRLQHQNQRIALPAGNMLLDHIGAYTKHLFQGNRHSTPLLRVPSARAAPKVGAPWKRGN